MSTDVLEHVMPSEVNRVVVELVRVTQAQMWLKIATRTEQNTNPLDDAHRRHMHTDVVRLHTTIMSLDAWAAAFRRHPDMREATVVRTMVHVALST